MSRLDLEACLSDVRDEIAYCRMMADRAADYLDGMDFGDRCYYDDRADLYTDEAADLETRLVALTYQGG